MSGVETVLGTFEEVDLDGKTIEEYAKAQFPEGTVKSDYYENWYEYLQDENDGNFFEHEGRLFKVTDQEDYSYDSFAKIEKTGEGKYNFVTSFHNGGTYLTEMLSEGIAKLNISSE